jgi:hypothetical protein
VKISRPEIIITYLIARFYIALATVAAVAATLIIWVGDKMNKRGQALVQYLKEGIQHDEN